MEEKHPTFIFLLTFSSCLSASCIYFFSFFLSLLPLSLYFSSLSIFVFVFAKLPAFPSLPIPNGHSGMEAEKAGCHAPVSQAGRPSSRREQGRKNPCPFLSDSPSPSISYVSCILVCMLMGRLAAFFLRGRHFTILYSPILFIQMMVVMFHSVSLLLPQSVK